MLDPDTLAERHVRLEQVGDPGEVYQVSHYSFT
jgi:hypothetical protein